MELTEIVACVEEEARRFRALGLLPSELQADDLRKAELLEAAAEQLKKIQNEKMNGPEPGQEALK